MGQNQARHRLQIIKENVTQITDQIKTDKLTDDDRGRSHDILLDYIKEIKFILSKSLRASRIRKVERLIIGALQELATLEGTVRNFEPKLKAKSMQKLNEIEKDLKTIKSKQHLDEGIDTVDKYKRRISLIEDVDPEVEVKKSKVLHVVTSTLHELESEEKLRQVQLRHNQGKLDLNRFIGVSESNCYKRHKQHLLSLRREIFEIPDASTKIKESKKYLLFNIDNNVAALDKKVRENEEVIKRQIIQEEFFPTPTTPSEDLLAAVVRSYANFESGFSANCSLQELQTIFKRLSELRMKIDQKLNVLENQMEIQEDFELVPVKETSFPIRKAENFPLRRFSRIKEIEKGVKDLQEEIVRSTYTRDSESYAGLKKKLEGHREGLNEVCVQDEDEESYVKSVLGYVNDVDVLLENNVIDRNSSSGDVLIDIISVSTIVNELGNSLQQVRTSEECESIGNELLENLYYLRKLELPLGRSNVCKFRDYVLIQIDSYLSNLEKIKRSAPKSKPAEAKNEEMFSF